MSTLWAWMMCYFLVLLFPSFSSLNATFELVLPFTEISIWLRHVELIHPLTMLLGCAIRLCCAFVVEQLRLCCAFVVEQLCLFQFVCYSFDVSQDFLIRAVLSTLWLLSCDVLLSVMLIWRHDDDMYECCVVQYDFLPGNSAGCVNMYKVQV